MIINFVKDQKNIFFVFVIIEIIFGIIFFLYSFPVLVYLYSLLLCFVITGLLFLYEFWKYNKKHKENVYILNSVNGTIISLPEASNYLEKDLIDIINAIDKNYRKVVSLSDTNMTEMVDFYTMWVHQIKTPISAMSILLQNNNDEYSSLLKQELFKIERYTEMVLGYLRVNSISSDLNLSEYKLESIVNQAIKKYATVFIHKKLAIKKENLDVCVITDEKWLLFALEQLISNSLKYTKSGYVKIYYISNQLVVEDSGIGISEEDLPRIFEKGFTGFNGRMDKKATGLGLYLCKVISDKLSFEIRAESNKDIGTKFYLSLIEK